MPWYTGQTLVEAFDALQQPKRPIHKPLRIPLHNVFRIWGIGYVSIGKVQTGVLKIGTVVTFAPCGHLGVCNSMEKFHKQVQEAIPGDYVGFHLTNSSLIGPRTIRRGFVAGDSKNDPPMDTENFIAFVIIMNYPGEIKAGYTPIIDVHTAHIACKFEELLTKADRRSGKKIENTPKFLKAGDAGLVKLVPKRSLCVESFSSYAPLGRFVIRDNKQIIGVGVVQEVKKKPCDLS